MITNAAATIDDALTNMRTIGRARPKGILKWNRASEITGNVRYVMAAAETFCVECRNHATRINEIRIVRNHMAHNNPGTRREFVTVVRRRLGAVPIRLPRAGAFVLRQSTAGITLLEEYVVTLGAIIRGRQRLDVHKYFLTRYSNAPKVTESRLRTACREAPKCDSCTIDLYLVAAARR